VTLIDPLHALLLALVQGLTEFLPVSSSAHLALLPVLTGNSDQGLAFDVAVHVGTLFAVVAYFRADLARMLAPGGGPEGAALRRLGGLALFATLPVAVIGLLIHDSVAGLLRSTTVIGIASIAFGLLLWVADRLGRRQRDERSLGWRDALWIGLAQALALIPGASRSGVTMTAALALGLEARAAARFSFLLSIPVIVLAGGYESVLVLRDAQPFGWTALAIGVLASALSAYACIHLFLQFLERVGFLPFVVYRVVLGALLLVFYP
jgi:undecaprenyl-diphosphatase